MMQIIGGKFKKRKLISPKGEQTRPTKNILRETFFNICAHDLQGAVFLDLFAGSGAMGFEALSRGAKHLYLIENHKNAIIAINKNIKLLEVEQSTTLIEGDVFDRLKKVEHMCDIIFADPPYAKKGEPSYSERLIKFLESHILLKENGRLFIEIGKDETALPSDHFQLVRTKKVGASQLIEYRT